MNILIAIDRFEDALTSQEAASYVEEGVKAVHRTANVISVPLFDGQKHLIDGILAWQQGTKYTWKIPDANMKRRDVTAAAMNDRFYIDCSDLYGQTENMLQTSSYGLGQMLLNGLDLDYRVFTIALGETALFDGGMGMLERLGAQFYDLNEEKLAGPLDSESIKKVRRIDLSGLDDRLSESTFTVISDYDYYLFGNKSQIAAQSLPDEAKTKLDNQIWYLNEQFKKTGLYLSLEKGGHAGGLRALFESLFHARTLSSKEMIFEETSIEELLNEADIIIYGGGNVKPADNSLVAQALTQKVSSDKRFIYLAAGQQFAPPDHSVYYLNIYPDMTPETDSMKLGIQLQNSIQTLLNIAR
ncbi:glycerate kinase [Macrococcus carouselicus]|uniref:Glycerate kinase n=1 Tax=Macrococcus carouselicus TaxID=69969 RepID=A0A9Q8FQ65_9STAP|nr:glycerate kinase [Macrococcus carouselicus]TDM03668.1 glycerate kinase [Macrococcus carouselicus]